MGERQYTLDEYNQVVNSDGTFDAVVFDMNYYGSVALLWTDRQATALRILFASPCDVGGSNTISYVNHRQVFVAVKSCGAYTFDSPVSADYVAEKLKLSGGVTLDAVAELINGVLSRL